MQVVSLHPKLVPRGVKIFLHYFPGCDHFISSKKLHCRFESANVHAEYIFLHLVSRVKENDGDTDI